MWEKLLGFLGLRAQARVGGLSASEANKAAAIALALEEAQKKAAAEAAAKK